MPDARRKNPIGTARATSSRGADTPDPIAACSAVSVIPIPSKIRKNQKKLDIVNEAVVKYSYLLTFKEYCKWSSVVFLRRKS